MLLLLLLLLQLNLLHEHRPFLVLASFVLEPDADDSRTKSRHLDQLFLHQCVWAWVGAVARAQRVKLFLVEYGAYARRLLVRTLVRPRPAAVLRCHRRRGWRWDAAVSAAAAVLTTRSCRIVAICNNKQLRK